MTKRTLAPLATSGVAVGPAALVASSTQPAGASSRQPAEKYKIVTVVKALGIGWFDGMNDGVERFATQTGNDATLTGARNASPEAEIKVIQDTLAAHPDAITVVPNSPQSLEGVLEQAMNAGIQVVTHEASSQANTDVDIEGFDKRRLRRPPALAAQDKLAVMLLEGKKIGPGLNLHIHGYTNLERITGSPHGLAGNAWVGVTRANVARYPF